MSNLASSSTCFCTAGKDTPRTLADQRQLGPLVAVEGDLETLALLGTQLSDALITTNNGAALLTGKGGYGPSQNTSSPFRISRNRINLRVCPCTNVQIFHAKDTAGSRSLVVATPDGSITHRIVTRSDYDERVITALDDYEEGFSLPNQSSSKAASNVVSLSAVRTARENWDRNDTGHHLNDILFDGGATRMHTLPHIGRNKAWQIIPETLPSFISYLLDKRFGHARLVPGSGFIQGDLVREGTASVVGSILLTRSAEQHFALDLDQVAAVWVTRIGPVSQIEIFDVDRRTIAILAADPMTNLPDWNELLASLPQVPKHFRSIQDAQR